MVCKKQSEIPANLTAYMGRPGRGQLTPVDPRDYVAGNCRGGMDINFARRKQQMQRRMINRRPEIQREMAPPNRTPVNNPVP